MWQNGEEKRHEQRDHPARAALGRRGLHGRGGMGDLHDRHLLLVADRDALARGRGRAVCAPGFDDIVGDDVPAEVRERLRQAHDALIDAGAPAELSSALQHPPGTPAGQLSRMRATGRRALRLTLAVAVRIATAAEDRATRSQPPHPSRGEQEVAAVAAGHHLEAAAVLGPASRAPSPGRPACRAPR